MFTLLSLFLETGFHCVALGVLELTLFEAGLKLREIQLPLPSE